MSRISAAFDVEPPAPFNVSRIACFSIVRHCRAGHDRRDARDRLGYNLGSRSPGLDQRARRQHDYALHGIRELAHLAGPVVRAQERDRVGVRPSIAFPFSRA